MLKQRSIVLDFILLIGASSTRSSSFPDFSSSFSSLEESLSLKIFYSGTTNFVSVCTKFAVSTNNNTGNGCSFSSLDSILQSKKNTINPNFSLSLSLSRLEPKRNKEKKSAPAIYQAQKKTQVPPDRCTTSAPTNEIEMCKQSHTDITQRMTMSASPPPPLPSIASRI